MLYESSVLIMPNCIDVSRLCSCVCLQSSGCLWSYLAWESWAGSGLLECGQCCGSGSYRPPVPLVSAGLLCPWLEKSSWDSGRSVAWQRMHTHMPRLQAEVVS